LRNYRSPELMISVRRTKRVGTDLSLRSGRSRPALGVCCRERRIGWFAQVAPLRNHLHLANHPACHGGALFQVPGTMLSSNSCLRCPTCRRSWLIPGRCLPLRLKCHRPIRCHISPFSLQTEKPDTCSPEVPTQLQIATCNSQFSWIRRFSILFQSPLRPGPIRGSFRVRVSLAAPSCPIDPFASLFSRPPGQSSAGHPGSCRILGGRSPVSTQSRFRL
jgi:hypothetical protein